MALIRSGTFQARDTRSRIQDFTPPNLLLTTLLVVTMFGPRQEAAARPIPRAQRQQIVESYRPPLTLFGEAPASTLLRRMASIIAVPRARPNAKEQPPPNLLLFTLAVPPEDPFKPNRAAIIPASRLIRRNPEDRPPPNLLVTTLTTAEPPDTTHLRRAPQIVPLRRIRAPIREIHAPPNLLLVPAIAGGGAEPEDVPRQPLLQDLARGHRRIRFVNHSLNLAIGTEAAVEPGTETLRTPILQEQPRRARFRGVDIYLRPGMGEAPVEPAGDPFFQKISDIDLSIRKPRARIVGYSLNLALGEFKLLPGESHTASAPRRLRRHIVEPIPNLLTSTLFVAPGNPFEHRRWEQASATRRKRPLPVESEGINNEIRGGGAQPFDPPRFFHQAATRRQAVPFTHPDQHFLGLPAPVVSETQMRRPASVQPLYRSSRARIAHYSVNMVLGLDTFFGEQGQGPFNYDWTIPRKRRPLLQESLYPNLLTTTLAIPPGVPFEPRRWEQTSATRARRSQDANTWLHRHNFALVEAAKHFKYDWTITRGKRPNPQEPVFRNFILSQPLAAPFEAWRAHFAASPRRYPVHERPTLDINLRPLVAGIKPIGAQYFEPAPRPRQSVARYTFLHPVNLNLLGKDTFFYGPGRGPFNYDWSIKLRYRYPERASLNDFQRGVPIGVIDFNPSVPGLEYSTFLEILEYRSKPDRLHFESLKDRLHYRIEDEDE